jgi:CRISPR-associated protein Csx17
MDEGIAVLLPGLSLCTIPLEIRSNDNGAVSAAFALLKLSLTPDSILRSLGLLPEGQHLSLPAGLPAQLAAGNRGNRAIATAWRRLRTAGLAPLFSPDALPTLGDIDPLRTCAALLIPLRYGAVGALARSVTKQSEPDLA